MSGNNALRLISVGIALFGWSVVSFAAVRPSISLHARVESNQRLTIHAAAGDNDGVVTNVEFFAALVGAPWEKIGETNLPAYQPVASPLGDYQLVWQATADRYNFIAVATDNSGLSSTSNTRQACTTLRPASTIISPQSNEVLNSGSPITFAIANVGTDHPVQSVRYSWIGEHDGIFWLGNGNDVVSTRAPFSFNWTNPVPGFYQLWAYARDTCGEWAVSSIPFTVIPGDGSAMIIKEPTPQSVAFGETATFAVDTLSLLPVRYQWRHNGTNLANATNNTLVITNAQLSDAGPYSALVTTKAGAVASLTAWLTIAGPGVLVQFRGGPIQAPGQFGFSVPMNSIFRAELWAGPSPPALAMIGSPVVMSNGYFDGGIRTIPTVIAPQPVYCQVRFELVTGSRVGNSTLRPYPTPFASLSNVYFSAAPEWPILNYSTQNITAPVGTNFTLSMYAGLDEFGVWTLQLCKDGIPVGEPLENVRKVFWSQFGTNISLTLTNLRPEDAGTYTLLASNSSNINISGPVRLTVLNKHPAILQQPKSSVVYGGDVLELAVIADGEPPLTYQWRHNGTNISGATEPRYVLSPVLPDSAGAYDVVVESGGGIVTSSIAQLVVISTPVITNQPVSRTVMPGSAVNFQVGALGPNLTYQWWRNGVPISGETRSSLSISNVQAGHGGNYVVAVSNRFGTSLGTARLTVGSGILVSPGTTVPYGSTVTFSALVDGPSVPLYWWRTNTTNTILTPLGAGPQITISNAQPLTVNRIQLSTNFPQLGAPVLMATPLVSVVSNLVILPPVLAINGDFAFQILAGRLATRHCRCEAGQERRDRALQKVWAKFPRTSSSNSSEKKCA